MNTDKLNENQSTEAQSPLLRVGAVIGGFSIVPQDKEFKFKKLCPYCQGDLTYTANGWEQDDNGLWMADSFDMDCSTEPDMEDEDEWNDWFNNHSDMPYVNQLPVDERVKKFINSKYRFDVGS
jgi:hypothetical protein